MDVLPRQADEVHLDAGRVAVPDGAVGERVHIEVGAKLAVEAHQQVAIEGSGHAERIVIGQEQLALGLHQVGADQQGIARARARRMVARNSAAPGGSKLPMFDPRKSTQRRRRARACRRRAATHPRSATGAVTTTRSRSSPTEREAEARAEADTSMGRCARAGATTPRTEQQFSLSPLPQPSSTSRSGFGCGVEDLRALRIKRRRSARVTGYHGRWQIASKSAEPSVSYSARDGSCRGDCER